MLILCWSLRYSIGLLKLSTSPETLVRRMLMQLSTMQLNTHAPQYMQSPFIIPIFPAFQNKAEVGHALTHNWHSTPLQARSSMIMSPSAKYSSISKDRRSFALIFLSLKFASFFFSRCFFVFDAPSPLLFPV